MPPKRSRRAGEGLGRRRREVEELFARLGLAAGPAMLHGADNLAALDFARRLRRAAAGLGPVFACFGLYLGSRVDLLPAECCLELAGIADHHEPLPAGEVLAQLERELGAAAPRLFASFEPRPVESRFLLQTHRATLAEGGRPVLVHLVRPGLEAAFARDLELLDLLEEPLARQARVASPLADVFADFRRSRLGQADLAAQAEALEDLAVQAAGQPLLAVPRVHRDASAARVLTIEELAGATLDEIARLERPLRPPRDAARRLCHVWLQQALAGRSFPVEPRGRAALVLPDGRIAFGGGPFAKPGPAAQTSLWDFLAATAARDPAAACAPLLCEMTPAEGAVGEEELALRLRQIVPFRDGSWSLAAESLAEHLFVAWRVARGAGYRPRPALVDFARGLAAVAAAARRLAPDRDFLLEAFAELRLSASFGQLRTALAPGRLSETLTPYAGLLFELPQKLDEVLTRMAKGEAQIRVELNDPPSAEGRRNSWSAVIALTLAMAAVVFTAERLASPEVLGVWGERAAAAALALLGLLLLRAATRA